MDGSNDFPPPVPDEAPDSPLIDADQHPVAPIPPIEDTQPWSSLTTPGGTPQEAPTPVSGGDGSPTLLKVPTKGDDWNFEPPTPELQKRIQEDLEVIGLYNAKTNGKWGRLTLVGIRDAISRSKSLSGEPSYELCVAVQVFAGKTDHETAILDEETWEAFAEALEAS